MYPALHHSSVSNILRTCRSTELTDPLSPLQGASQACTLVAADPTRRKQRTRVAVHPPPLDS